jgi:hypothetical protein
MHDSRCLREIAYNGERLGTANRTLLPHALMRTLSHMSTFRRCSVGLGAALLLCAADTSRAQRAASGPLRALFIGNSYIYVNDLPAVVADLAKAANEKRPFVPDVVVVGGSTLEAHVQRGDALAAIKRGGWDVVVLQEQSTRPITDPTKMWHDVMPLADAAKAAGARVLLYETWAREVAPDTQDSLTHVYHHAAELAGASVAHVGEPWSAFRAQEGALPSGTHSVLFRADGSHPTPAGTYLAASVLYETIYGKSPVGLPGATRETMDQPPVGPAPDAPKASVPPALAKQLQELAWKYGRP